MLLITKHNIQIKHRIEINQIKQKNYRKNYYIYLKQQKIIIYHGLNKKRFHHINIYRIKQIIE